jgi:DNA polymerase III gamma/tau subunit
MDEDKAVDLPELDALSREFVDKTRAVLEEYEAHHAREIARCRAGDR